MKSPHAFGGVCLAVEPITNLALAWQMRAPGTGNTDANQRLAPSPATAGGISSEVALTLTQQEIALSDIATVRSPQEALRLRQM